MPFFFHCLTWPAIALGLGLSGAAGAQSVPGQAAPVPAVSVHALPRTASPQAASPQAASDTQPAKLRFGDYLDAVEQHSLQLRAQQQSVESARAEVGIAGIRPDPEFKVETSREQVKTGLPRPYSREYELTMELETGGKRGARIKAAHSGVRLAEAHVESFRHQLYADSAEAFAEACRSRAVVERKERTLKALGDMVAANDVRRKAGDIGGIELLQSRVERDQFMAQVVAARAEVQMARQQMALPLGRRLAEVFHTDLLNCDFVPLRDADDVNALVEQAIRLRDDVRVAEATLEHARDNAGVAQANRWVNPTVAVGMGTTSGTSAGIDAEGNAFEGSGRSRTLAVSVSVPIPFSRLNRGEVLQAEAAVTEAMLELQQAQHKAEADVRSAHFLFAAARENVQRYRDGVLHDAQRVLEGMRLSYRQGEASLLELLSAQRSADEAYLEYLQSEADLVKATVDLQLSAGRRPAL